MNCRTIKALKTCQFLPAAEREILDSLPEELTEQLTSKQLALVMQALDKHWHKACAWKEKQFVADGYIWDGKQLCDLVPTKKQEYGEPVGNLSDHNRYYPKTI